MNATLVAAMMAAAGTAAISLMAIHIVFAVIVMRRDTYRTRFHTWSLAIYGLWLISYALGPIGLIG